MDNMQIFTNNKKNENDENNMLNSVERKNLLHNNLHFIFVMVIVLKNKKEWNFCMLRSKMSRENFTRG